MALIKCPECGKEISDKATACPNCGNPMNQQTQQEEYLCCPKCGSRELHTEHKGFSGGKALAGAILTGGIGLLAGTIGSRETEITCLKCGKKFKAGEAKVVRKSSNVTLSSIRTPIPNKHICSICGYIYEGDSAPAKCPICKSPAENFQPLYENFDDESEIIRIIQSQGKLSAVKWYKEKYNCGLKEAKDTVDEIAAKHITEVTSGAGRGCSIFFLIGISATLGALFML